MFLFDYQQIEGYTVGKCLDIDKYAFRIILERTALFCRYRDLILWVSFVYVTLRSIL